MREGAEKLCALSFFDNRPSPSDVILGLDPRIQARQI